MHYYTRSCGQGFLSSFENAQSQGFVSKRMVSIVGSLETVQHGDLSDIATRFVLSPLVAGGLWHQSHKQQFRERTVRPKEIPLPFCFLKSSALVAD